jgi:NADH:ubiquinone oxidoreductase subunit 3 (subunit A)
MAFYFYLFLADTAFIVILLLIKTFLFFAGDYSAGFADWLYFSKYNIYGSRNEQIEKAKRRQNGFSIFIMILVILDLLLLLLWHIS